MIFRQIATPINEIIRILDIAKKHNIDVLILEYLKDKFTPSINAFKYNLGKLPIYRYNGTIKNIDSNIIYKNRIVDFAKMEGRNLDEVQTINNESLVGLHHSLFENITGINIKRIAIDGSEWFRQYGRPSEYYRHFFKLFLSHNILSEEYLETGIERRFTHQIIFPNIAQITKTYHYHPLIWNYLDGAPLQMKNYWDGYPAQVGELLTSRGYK